MKRPETPFPRHWLYYLILKYAVIAAAIIATGIITKYEMPGSQGMAGKVFARNCENGSPDSTPA